MVGIGVGTDAVGREDEEGLNVYMVLREGMGLMDPLGSVVLPLSLTEGTKLEGRR